MTADWNVLMTLQQIKFIYSIFLPRDAMQARPVILYYARWQHKNKKHSSTK